MLTFSRLFKACIQCGKSDVKHMAKGLCARCYSSNYAKLHPEKMKEQKHAWYIRQGAAEFARIQRENFHFDGQRELALKRDGYKCQSCGSKDKLTVHHLDGKGRGVKRQMKNNSIDNLQTLCRACHARAHHCSHKWSWNFAQCVYCKTTTVKHRAFGLCVSCYSRRVIREARMSSLSTADVQTVGRRLA